MSNTDTFSGIDALTAIAPTASEGGFPDLAQGDAQQLITNYEGWLSIKYGDLRAISRSFESKYGRALSDVLAEVALRDLEAQYARAERALVDATFETEFDSHVAAWNAWWYAADADWAPAYLAANFPLAEGELDGSVDRSIVEIGTIFVCSLGWDQTNVSYYEVVKVTPARVTLRPIAKRTVRSGSTDLVMPIPGEFVGSPFTRKPSPSEPNPYSYGSDYEPYVSVSISSFQVALTWCGKPNMRSYD